jgi:hypothetical protein
MVGKRVGVAQRPGRLYVLGDTGLVIIIHDDQSVDSVRKSISGAPVGLVEARGGTMIAGASDGILVISDDGDRLLPLQAARIERVAASPRSPYVLAQVEGHLLLWNLDDVQPRRLIDHPAGRAQFADVDHAVVGGTPDIGAQLVDLTTGATRALGEWQDLRAVTSAGPGRAIALIDGARRIHLAVPGREPQQLPGDVDLAGFATETQLVLATSDGAGGRGTIAAHDVASGQRATLVERPSPVLGLAWGRGHHPWVAAAFADGTLWRSNVATGATATIARAPAIDRDHPAPRDGKLLIAADGAVTYLHDGEIRAWRADGALAQIARAPKPLEELGEAGPDHIVAIANDTTIYAIDRTAGSAAGGLASEALASIESSSAAMSPDTGLLVAVERGALQILDPLVHQRWTLALPAGVQFQTPAISADGRRVVANTASSVLAWTIELPANPEATIRFLDAMTNAVDDPRPGGLGWR